MITPFYAALLALIFVGLSFRTLLLRRKLRIPIGSGDDPVLARAIRVHANFAEYVPLALLLIIFVEGRTGASMLVHGLCIALTLGRIIHAYGVSQVEENLRLRVSGMILTLGTIIYAALRLIVSYLV